MIEQCDVASSLTSSLNAFFLAYIMKGLHEGFYNLSIIRYRYMKISGELSFLFTNTSSGSDSA